MSSILDALKKLEADKAKAREAAAEGSGTGAAGEDLFGRKTGGRITIHVGPATLVGGVVVIALVLLGVFRWSRQAAQPPGNTPQLAQAATPAPTAPAPESPKPQAPTTPQQSAPSNPAAAQEPEPDVPVPARPAPPPREPVAPPPEPAPVAAAPEEPKPEPPEATAPVVTVVQPQPPPAPAPPKPPVSKPKPAQQPASEPEPIVVASATSPPAPDRLVEAEPGPQAAPPSLPEPQREDMPPVATQAAENAFDPSKLFDLPMLRRSEQVRYGLEDLQINMPRPATKRRPLASAIINLQPVFVGETIPGTRAVLVGVDMRGIAIEVEGRHFYVRFGRRL